MILIDDKTKKIKNTHTDGFFCDCSGFIRCLLDFCVRDNIFYELDTKNQWALYKDDITQDVYNKFFKMDNKFFKIKNGTFSKIERGDQFINYRLINYKFVNPYVKKYFSLSDEVKFIVKDLKKKYKIDYKNTIAVLYRGNDKSKETDIPSYDEINIKLNEIKNNYPGYRIIIQSDEKEFCDYMLKHENSFVFDESIKINRSHLSHITQIIPEGSKIKNAQIFLAIMSIISKCHVILLNSGNVGMWACLFRGNANNVYQFLRHPYGENPNMVGWINE